MSVKQVVRCTFAVAIALAMVISCSLLPPREITVTPDMRVTAFLAALNAADHSTVYLNLDPAVKNYDDMITHEYWDVFFPVVGPADDPYTYSGLVIGAPDTSGIITVTATLNYDPDWAIAPKALVMTLELVDLYTPYESWWMIETLTRDGMIVVEKQ
jgi:hypothetical protein